MAKFNIKTEATKPLFAGVGVTDLAVERVRDYVTVAKVSEEREKFRTQAELDAYIGRLDREMREAAANLEFERAAKIRDKVRKLRNPDLVVLEDRSR